MPRKLYHALIINKLKEHEPGWLFRRVAQYLRIWLATRYRRPLCGPVLGSLLVTYRCNFECVMCDLPLRASEMGKTGLKEYDTSRFKAIIRELAAIGTAGIGFTGGEPLLRDDIFELLADARNHGLITNISTNGWLLGEAEARRFIDIGIDTVNISLDGASAATHDQIRRRPGAFARAVEAIECMVHSKRKYNGRTRIKAVTVLNQANADELISTLELGKQLGVDSVEVIPQHSFTRHFENTASPSKQTAKIAQQIQLLKKQHHLLPLLENSARHLDLLYNCLSGRPSPITCTAGYTSVAVDCYGTVFPCVPWLNWNIPCGTLENSSLQEQWYSSEYQAQRQKTGQCHRCYLNCQAELNLLFDLQRHASLGHGNFE